MYLKICIILDCNNITIVDQINAALVTTNIYFDI